MLEDCGHKMNLQRRYYSLSTFREQQLTQSQQWGNWGTQPTPECQIVTIYVNGVPNKMSIINLPYLNSPQKPSRL